MASKQPSDEEILTLKPRKLKEYIKTHGIDPSKLAGIDKTRLQFYAMDVTKWDKPRLLSLKPQFRSIFLEKLTTDIDKETRAIFMDSTDVAQREQTIDKLLTLLPQSDPLNIVEAIDDKQNEAKQKADEERAVTLSREQEDPTMDDMSSVSTHSSMPSLMSDDDSDEEDETESDSDNEHDNNQASALLKEEEISMKSVNAAAKTQRNKNGTKKTKGNDDDFLSGLQKAFANKKGKKKDKKKQKKQKSKPKAKQNKKGTKSQQKSPNTDAKKSAKNSKTSNANQNEKKANDKTQTNVKENKDKIERNKNEKKSNEKKEKNVSENKKSGYHLKPNADAYKNSKGGHFLCIGQRGKQQLNGCRYIKVYLSLKNKLKKRAKNKALYFAVIIDMNQCKEREIEREILLRRYDNVLSFNINKHHYIMDVKEQNETRLSLDEAFARYAENGAFVNVVTKPLKLTKKPQILDKKVNTQQQKAKQQMADIQSKLEALSVHNNEAQKDDGSASYLTTELLNSCRLHKRDLYSLMDDASKDEAIKGLYVRATITGTGSEHRVLEIEETKHHNNNHYLMCRYSNTKYNIKITKVSNDAFTANEIKTWIKRLKKDRTALPNDELLTESADKLCVIREAVALKKTLTQSDREGLTLNYQNLAQLNRLPSTQRTFYLSKYTQAINIGANCFWCIPTAETAECDSKYIAFLLMKTSRNDDNLQRAKQIAMNVRSDILVLEIREWTAREDQKSGHWKSKGWFMDCRDKKYAYQITQKLLEFLPQTVGNRTPANFCRRVLKEFGDSYVGQRQKPSKSIKNKPQGPRYNYKDGEPSIVSMSECPHKVTFKPGEKDYHTIQNDDVESVSSLYSMSSVNTAMTHKTVSKYDQYSHMMFPQKPDVNAIGYRVNDKVMYLGKEYDVVWLDGDHIRIENDAESELVRPHEINHVY